MRSLTPMQATLFLLGCAFVLLGGFYAAASVAEGQEEATPRVGWWDDEPADRFLVVTVDRDVDWGDLAVGTDRPARVTLEGHAPATTVPGVPALVAPAGTPLSGGDALAVCLLGPAGVVQVTVWDGEAVLLQRSLRVRSC